MLAQTTIIFHLDSSTIPLARLYFCPEKPTCLQSKGAGGVHTMTRASAISSESRCLVMPLISLAPCYTGSSGPYSALCPQNKAQDQVCSASYQVCSFVTPEFSLKGHLFGKDFLSKRYNDVAFFPSENPYPFIHLIFLLALLPNILFALAVAISLLSLAKRKGF